MDFFQKKKKTLNQDLIKLSELDISIIFFISSKKLKKIIPYLKKYFINRKVVICREMTKYYEEYIRTEINNIDKINFELKGEITIIISEKIFKEKTSLFLSESDKSIISKMINKFTIKEIVEIINKNNKISKKEIYNYCLSLKDAN